METNIELEEDLERLGLQNKVVVTTKDHLHQFSGKSSIVNLQDDVDIEGNDLTGTHWVAVFLNGKEACYFDPIGIAPPSEVQLYLYKRRPYPYSSQQVQDEKGGHCGRYCLAFLWFMYNNHKVKPVGKRLEKFLQMFSTDVKDNADLIKQYTKWKS
jgi:hypothetical protein